MENELEKRSEKALSFFKGKKVYFYLFLIIMIFALGIRIYYFSNYNDQAMWWDESQYLWRSRDMANGNWFNPDWDENALLMEPSLPPHKPFLIVFAGAFFYLLGLNGETAVKFLMMLVSFIGVLFTYFAAKEMYNKKTGLIASALMSVFYLYNFWSYRISTNVFGTTFWMITVFLLWRGYITKPSKKLMFWAGAFMSLTILGRTTLAMMVVPVLALFIVKDGWKFIKNKRVWFFALGGFIVMLPYMIWSQITYKMPLAWASEWFGSASEAGAITKHFTNLFNYIQLFNTTYLNSPIKILLILFVIGLVIYLFNLIIGFDIMFKNKDKKLIRTFFVILWILLPILLLGVWVGWVEPRYILVVFPAVFMVVGDVLMKGYELVKKWSKPAAVIVILLIVISSMAYQFKQGDELIKVKAPSYMQVKEAGLWIDQNAGPDDVIFSQSWPQIEFYGNRKHIGLTKKATRYFADLNESEAYLTKDEFEELAIAEGADYFIVSIFETYPQWAYTYAQENPTKITPVMAYYMDEQQTQVALIIYELNFT
ncbi:MAG: glycosyltransferase family 39 protein [Nanoarchaeota archaeon]|nr:glycosyltransferase family 39 protein [Nanoarchaeota archaeon]